MDAARDALDWLDLADHQAVVVAHTDEPHPHVHLAINTVHPITGKTASLYQCKKALSAWAMHWEETHGGIVVESRTRADACAEYSVRDGTRRPLPLLTDAPEVTADNDNAPKPVQPAHPPPSILRLVSITIRLRSRFMRAASLLTAMAPLLLLFSTRPSPTGPPIARPPNTPATPVLRSASPNPNDRPRYRL